MWTVDLKNFLTLNNEFIWKKNSSGPIGWSLRFVRELRSSCLLRNFLRALRWMETPLYTL